MEIDFSDVTFDFEKVIEKNERPEQGEGDVQEERQKPGEICKFFLKGTCMKEGLCPFRHSRNDRAVVCKHWLRGLCKKNENCEFLHEYDMTKMPECYFFSNFGECSNPECVYLHIPPEVKYRDCPWYARGFCKHGPRCRHKHLKKVACDNYLLGFCPAGPDCKYGHPKYELPKEGEGSTIKTPMICHKCGSIGHKALMCPVAGGGRELPQMADGKAGLRSLENVTCFKCGQMGHYANMCPNKRVPAPPGGYAIPLNNNPSGEYDPNNPHPFPAHSYPQAQPFTSYSQQGNQPLPPYYGSVGGFRGGPPNMNYQNQIPVWGGNS